MATGEKSVFDDLWIVSYQFREANNEWSRTMVTRLCTHEKALEFSQSMEQWMKQDGMPMYRNIIRHPVSGPEAHWMD